MNAWEKCSTKGRGPVETPGKVTCKRRDTHVEEDGDEDNAREDGEDPPILHGNVQYIAKDCACYCGYYDGSWTSLRRDAVNYQSVNYSTKLCTKSHKSAQLELKTFSIPWKAKFIAKNKTEKKNTIKSICTNVSHTPRCLVRPIIICMLYTHLYINKCHTHTHTLSHTLVFSMDAAEFCMIFIRFYTGTQVTDSRAINK